MAFYRENHRAKGGFTQISNALICDTRVSEKAKMYLVIMLSRPDVWRFNIDGLLHLIKGGKSALQSGIKELERFGYLKRVRKHINGRFEYTYEIYESPTAEQNSKPEEEKPPVKNKEQKNSPQKNSEQKISSQYFSSQKSASHSNTGSSSNTEKSNTDLQRESEKSAHAEKQAKQTFGKYKNVQLTDDEYRKLVELYGKDQTDYSIDTLSDFKKKTHNCKCRNDFSKLMNTWIKQDIDWGKTPKTYVPCQYGKQEKSDNFDVEKYKIFINDFDVEKYDIFVNDFDVANADIDQTNRLAEEREKEDERKDQEDLDRKQAKRDAHFAEMMAHIQKHFSEKEKSEPEVPETSDEIRSQYNDFMARRW